ncbi:MAG: hypothetical protein PF637_14505 [Spirochaetes bacterium]|jgi:hypothetical protein|nr:hypothetical protein [Spirochaetota bacterium]
MKQIIGSLALMCILMVLGSCSKNPTDAISDAINSDVAGYGEMISVLNDYVDIQEKYLKSLKNIESSEDLIKTLETYGESMSKIMPVMMELSEKYPELNDIDPPKEIEERLEQISLEIQEETPKAVMEYQSDPKVQEAFMKMASLMGGDDMDDSEE